PEWESVHWAWDKRDTYRLAQQLGIPTPRTFYFDRVSQLSELDHLDPPFAIKPAIKEHFFYATKAKAWCANSHSELKTLFGSAPKRVAPGEYRVQDLIRGGAPQHFAFCVFSREGEAVEKMAARRWRQHPLQFGRASTYVETAEVPILEELSEHFLRAINY